LTVVFRELDYMIHLWEGAFNVSAHMCII